MEAERKKISEKINNELIPLCCNNNKYAEDYLKRLFYIVRLIDDIYDYDYKVEKKEIIKGFFLFIADITTNDFYRKNQDMLTSIHIVAYNAWEDANLWAKNEDKNKRLYAHILRDYICEVFILVAYLTGGSNSMRSVSLKVREAFLKEFEY